MRRDGGRARRSGSGWRERLHRLRGDLERLRGQHGGGSAAALAAPGAAAFAERVGWRLEALERRDDPTRPLAAATPAAPAARDGPAEVAALAPRHDPALAQAAQQAAHDTARTAARWARRVDDLESLVLALEGGVSPDALRAGWVESLREQAERALAAGEAAAALVEEGRGASAAEDEALQRARAALAAREHDLALARARDGALREGLRAARREVGQRETRAAPPRGNEARPAHQAPHLLPRQAADAARDELEQTLDPFRLALTEARSRAAGLERQLTASHKAFAEHAARQDAQVAHLAAALERTRRRARAAEARRDRLEVEHGEAVAGGALQGEALGHARAAAARARSRARDLEREVRDLRRALAESRAGAGALADDALVRGHALAAREATAARVEGELEVALAHVAAGAGMVERLDAEVRALRRALSGARQEAWAVGEALRAHRADEEGVKAAAAALLDERVTVHAALTKGREALAALEEEFKAARRVLRLAKWIGTLSIPGGSAEERARQAEANPVYSDMILAQEALKQAWTGVAGLRQDVAAVRDAVDDKEAGTQWVQQEVRSLSNALQDARALAAALERAREGQQERMDGLEDDLADAQGTLREAREQVAELRAILDESPDLERLRSQLAEARVALDYQQQRSASLERRLARAEQRAHQAGPSPEAARELEALRARQRVVEAELRDAARLLESETWRGFATHRDLVRTQQRLQAAEQRLADPPPADGEARDRP